VRGDFVSDTFGTNLSFYDTELEVPCFASEVAGEEGAYCVPGRFADIFFTDESCGDDSAVAFARNSTCGGPAAGDLIFYTFPQTSCETGTRLFRLGAATATPETLYWRSFPSGECQAVEPRPGTFHLVEPARADGLVSVTRTVESIPGSDLQVAGTAGEEGSFLPEGLAASGESCSTFDTSEGQRCFPLTWRASGTGYLDDTCTTAAVLVDNYLTECATFPELVQILSEDQCPVVSQVHRIAGELAPAYGDNGDACVGFTNTVMALVPGEEVPLTSFPSVEQVWVGAGAVETLYHASNGTPLTAGRYGLGFRLTATGVPCTPQDFVDGTRRCLPATQFGFTGNGYYSDENCEAELYGAYSSTPCGEEPSLDDFVVLEQDLEDTCRSRATRAVRLVPHQGAVYSRNNATGDCALDAEAANTMTLFVTGEEIPLSEMPEIPARVAR
jgi:hypothetical protein